MLNLPSTYGLRDSNAYSIRHFIDLIAVHSGIGAGDWGTGHAAFFLKNAGIEHWLPEQSPHQWHDIGSYSPELNNYSTQEMTHDEILTEILHVNLHLSKSIEDSVRQKHKFCVLGGDHSCAIGTWSGVANALGSQEDFGLIWIDAHMDAHIPETSPSGQLHGMPLAHLLGFGLPELQSLSKKRPALKPENLCLIGVRSWETEEYKFLSDLNVKIITMAEVASQGIEEVFTQALRIVDSNCAGFGVSLDLDVIDPTEAPGVGSPVPYGVSSQILTQTLSTLTGRPDFLGIELVEFNPFRDENNRTLQVIRQLVSESFLGDTI